MGLALAPHGQAQEACEKPGPDDHGYSCSETEFEWESTFTDGVNLTIDDDGFVNQDLPFDFPFYEDTYSEVNISDNGFVCFTNCTDNGASYIEQVVPDENGPNNLVACAWTDLDPRTADRVTYDEEGSRVVVHYANLTHIFSDEVYNLQLWLDQGGSARCMLDQIPDDGQDKTAGIENVTGTDGVRNRSGSWGASEVGVLFARAPATPTLLSAEGGDQEIRLDWSHPDSGAVDHYAVECQVLDAGNGKDTGDCVTGEWTYLTEVPGGTTAHTQDGLGDDVEIEYRVRANNSAGSSAPSDVLGNVTLDEPSKPANLAASPVDGELTVELSWEAPEFDGNSEIDRYRVAKDGSEIANATPDEFGSGEVFTFSDGEVACGDSPSYEVEARNAKGWSENPATASPTVDHVCPDPPQNLEATAGIDWVNATWDPPGDEEKVDEYVVAWKKASASDFNEDRTTETSHNITGLASKEDYEVRVRSFNDTGGPSGNATATASTFGLPGPPENVATVPSLESIEVLWKNGSSGGEDVDHYRIERVNQSNDATQEVGTKAADENLSTVDGDTYYRFTDDGENLTNCATYDYKVFAVNKAGSGPEGTPLVQQGAVDSTEARPIDTETSCGGDEDILPAVAPDPPLLSVHGPIAGEGAVQLTINYTENQPQEAHEYDIDMRPVGQEDWDDARKVDAVQTRVDEGDRDGEIQVRVDGVLCTSAYEFRTRGRYGQAETSLDWGEWSDPATGSVDHHPPGHPENFSAKPVASPTQARTIELNWTNLEDVTSEELRGCYDGDFTYNVQTGGGGNFTVDEAPQTRTVGFGSPPDCQEIFTYRVKTDPQLKDSFRATPAGEFSALDNTTMEGCPEQPRDFSAERSPSNPTTVVVSWECPESWGTDALGHAPEPDAVFKLHTPDETVTYAWSDLDQTDGQDCSHTVQRDGVNDPTLYEIEAQNDQGQWGPLVNASVGQVPTDHPGFSVSQEAIDGGQHKVALHWDCNTDQDLDGDDVPDPETPATHDFKILRNGEHVNTTDSVTDDCALPRDASPQAWDTVEEKGKDLSYRIQPVGPDGEELSPSLPREITTWDNGSGPSIDGVDVVVTDAGSPRNITVTWSADPGQRGFADARHTEYVVTREPAGPDGAEFSEEPSQRRCQVQNGVETCTDFDELGSLAPCTSHTWKVQQTEPLEGQLVESEPFTPHGPAGWYNESSSWSSVSDAKGMDTVWIPASKADDPDGDEVTNFAYNVTTEGPKGTAVVSLNRSLYQEGCNDPADNEQYLLYRDTPGQDAQQIDLIGPDASEFVDEGLECGQHYRYRVQPTFPTLPSTDDANFQTKADRGSDWSGWFEFTCPDVQPPNLKYARGGPDAFEIRICWEADAGGSNPSDLLFVVSPEESDDTWIVNGHDGLICVTDDRAILEERPNIPRRYTVRTVAQAGAVSEAEPTNLAFPADPGLTNEAPRTVRAEPGNWYGEVHLEWEPVTKRDLADNRSWPSDDVPAKAAPDPDRYDVYYDPNPEDGRSAVKIGEATSSGDAGYENATVYRQQLCVRTDMAFGSQVKYRPQCTIPKEPAAPDADENATFHVRPVWLDTGSTDGPGVSTVEQLVLQDKQRVWTDQEDPTVSEGTHYGVAGSDTARPADTGTLAHVYVRGEETNVHLSGKNVEQNKPGTNVSEVHVHANYTQWSEGEPEPTRVPGTDRTIPLDFYEAEGVHVTYWDDNQTAKVVVCEREGSRGPDTDRPMDQRKGVDRCVTLAEETLPLPASSSPPDCPEVCRMVTDPIDILDGDRLGIEVRSKARLALETVPAGDQTPLDPGISSAGDGPGG